MENNGSNGNGTHSLTGKVALVTGAGRGIGRAIALELAHRGANIALNYRSDTAHAELTCNEIREIGVECIIVQGDVSKKGEAHRIVKEVLGKWQRLDILVNNAGITRDRSMRKMTDDDWAEVISVSPERHFLLHQRRFARHDQPKIWPGHQHQFGGRANGRFRSGQLFGQ